MAAYPAWMVKPTDKLQTCVEMIRVYKINRAYDICHTIFVDKLFNRQWEPSINIPKDHSEYKSKVFTWKNKL